MKKRGVSRSQAQLRQLVKPLRLTDTLWSPDGLEKYRLQRRLERLETEYTTQVFRLYKRWHRMTDEEVGLWPTTWQQTQDLLPDVEPDEQLLMLKLWNNLRWAWTRGNKFLLSEEIDRFPIMNYTLREGPYTPPLDAKLGIHDRQLVLKATPGKLVLFFPALHGLTQGVFLEGEF